MAVEKILATDSLNDGRVKLNAAIEQSNEAITKATTADENASQAVTTANSVQEQFNQVVIEGDSSVEAAQARVSYTGTTYTTLKERLDQEHESVTTQLAETQKKIPFYVTPEMFGAKGDGTTDDTLAIQQAIDYAKGTSYDVKFSARSYVTSSPLSIPSNIRLIGSQSNMNHTTGTKIKNSVSDMLFIEQDRIGKGGYYYNNGSRFYGISFIGSGKYKFIANSERTFLNWGRIDQCAFQGFVEVFPYVAFTGYYIHNIMIYDTNTIGNIGGSDNSFYHWMVNSLETTTNRKDYFAIIQNMTLTTFEDIYMTGALETGKGAKSLFRLEYVSGCNFNHVVFDYCDYYAILGNYEVKGNTFEHCYFRGVARATDARYAIHIGTLNKDNKFINNYFAKVHTGDEKSPDAKLFYFNDQSTNNIVKNNYYDTEIGGLTYYAHENASFIIDEPGENTFIVKNNDDYQINTVKQLTANENRLQSFYQQISRSVTNLTARFSEYPQTIMANSKKDVTLATLDLPLGSIYSCVFHEKLPDGLKVFQTTYSNGTVNIVLKNTTSSDITLNTDLLYDVYYLNLA